MTQKSGELVPDGKGGFTSQGTVTTAAVAAKTLTAKAAVELPPGAKELMTPILTKASEALQATIDLISSSKVADVPDDGTMPAVPEDVWAGLVNCVKLISQLESMYPKGPPSDAPDAEDDPAQGGDAGVDESTETPDGVQMRNTLKAVLGKVGAKMSKERLSRFGAALDTLGSILGELQGPQPAPAAAPAAPAVGKTLAAKAEPAQDPALTAQLTSLAGTVAALTKLVQNSNATVQTIAKARGMSNALSVEGGSGENDDVSWPMDMNRPSSKDGPNLFG